jgi:hypothetical protein
MLEEGNGASGVWGSISARGEGTDQLNATENQPSESEEKDQHRPTTQEMVDQPPKGDSCPN